MIHPPWQRSAGRFEYGSSCLLLSGDDNTSDSGEQDFEQLNASKNEMTTKPADEKSKSVARGVFEVATSFLSILFTGFGAAFTLGLLLNLNGYGYRFSVQEGVRIDTLDEMRMERQLNQVSTSSDVSESTKPSPVAAVGDFFMRQPFTASLLLTGVALLYEEVVKVPQAKRSKESNTESSDNTP
jgi:hypothetical protein